MITRVKGGDMTFGAKTSASSGSPGLRRVDAPGLASPPAFPQLAPPPQGASLSAQVSPAPTLPTGDTQNIILPPLQPSPFASRRPNGK